MQLRLDALDAHLSKSLAPLYVIASDEHLLALEAADKIRKTARAQGVSERDVLVVGREYEVRAERDDCYILSGFDKGFSKTRFVVVTP